MRLRGVVEGLKTLFLVVCLCSIAALAQNDVQPAARNGKETANYTFVTSGDSANFIDNTGTVSNQFELKVLNAPGTLTATVVGCMRGQTCSGTLASNTGAASQTLSAEGPYDYYKVTVSWTAQSNGNGVLVNRTAITGAGHGGVGANVVVTGPVDGSNNLKVNCITGCAGSNPNGQAAMASSAPVVIASNQSAIPSSQSGTWSVNQSLGTTGFEKITDGTNTAAVKPASTVVGATDPSLAVGLSPNSPLPAGTNAIGSVSPSLISNALITGQQSVTASAVALPTTTLNRPACIQALPGNGQTVYLGPAGVTTSTGFPLPPGAGLCNLPISNLNQIFVIAASIGSSVSWSAQ